MLIATSMSYSVFHFPFHLETLVEDDYVKLRKNLRIRKKQKSQKIKNFHL